MPYEAALLLCLLSLLAVVVGLDVIRADVASVIALLGLAGLQQLPGVTAFVDVEQLFSGFSSTIKNEGAGPKVWSAVYQ